jgi:hypothetical protein
MYEGSAFATVNDRGGVDYAPHNHGITPVFRIATIIDPAASEKAGRAIHVAREEVTLYIAGDQLSAATHPADVPVWGTVTPKQRFEEAYEKWKGKGQRFISGTPLDKWPLATPIFIKEMEFLNIYSVDDLAGVADVHLDRIADGRQWRDKAAAWLKSAKDGAAAAQYAAENARLREEMAALSAKVERLSGVTKRTPREIEKAHDEEIAAMELEAQERPKPRKRPRKRMSKTFRAAASERAKAMWAARKRREAPMNLEGDD